MTFRLSCCEPTYWANVWHHSTFCKARDEHGLPLAAQRVPAELLRGDELDEAVRDEFTGHRLWPRDWSGDGCTCFELERGLCPKCSEDGKRIYLEELDKREAL